MANAQAFSALMLFCAGFVLGLVWDFYRVLRRLSNPGRLQTAACDLLFWLVYTVWVAVLLQRTTAGEVRFYVFLSIACGVWSYFHYCSRRFASAWYLLIYHVMNALHRLANLVGSVFTLVGRVLLWPYRLITNLLLRPIWWLLALLLTPVSWLFRSLSRFFNRATHWLFHPFRVQLGRLRRCLANSLISPPKE